MKQFLIVGNGNAVTYKDVFPLIKENKLWLGNKNFSGGMDFVAGENFDISKCKHLKYDEKGNIIINVMATWYTTLIPPYIPPLVLTKSYTPDTYPKYDNYDAIEVGKVCEIPMDYDGVMGVPITFLDKYCPDQFEILGITENADYLKSLYIENCEKYDRPYLDGKRMYSRLLIRHRK